MPSAFMTNMSAPMPIHRKLYLLTRNIFIRVAKHQDCCGHPVSPAADRS